MKAKNVVNKAMSFLVPLAITAGSFQAQAQMMTMNGRSPMDLVPPEPIAQQREVVARVAPGQVARPQQYVVLAFDGSYRNSTWQYLRKFTKNQKAKNDVDVHFTFFINPVYLYERSLGLQIYHPPGGHKGSAIGWGDDQADISERLDNMNGAYAEGHEIGSHAVGHFDGSRWSAADWSSEFTQFNYMLDNVFSLNKLRTSTGLAFRKDIVGFRAPLLGYSAGLYQALPKFGIKYDTSQQDSGTNYWPQVRRDSNTWNFPLARVAIPGTAKKYPTMDYNFCANDSLELLRQNPDLINFSGPDPMTGKILSNRGKSSCLSVLPREEKEFIKNRTIQAYMNYFNSNYYGSRAPVSIGHHFSPWMSGAYFDAMMYIADTVCKKPEVKCVTNRELLKFMNEKTATGEVQAYRAGAFAKMQRPKAVREEAALDIEATLVKAGDDLKIEVSGRDAKMKGLTTALYLNDKVVGESSASLEQIRKMVSTGSTVQLSAIVKNRQGVEVQAATHVITDIGLTTEQFSATSLESSFQKGDLPGAHEGANAEDFSRGH